MIKIKNLFNRSEIHKRKTRDVMIESDKSTEDNSEEDG